MTTHRRSVAIIISAAFFASQFLSCSSIQLVDTSAVTYKTDEFDFNRFERSTIAVLPVLAGEGYEGFRRLTGESLGSALRQTLSTATIRSHSETLGQINTAGLSSSYSSAIENYSKTAILDKKVLNDLGTALKADYLVYSRIGSSSKTRVETALETIPVHTQTTVNEIEIFVQVWDTQKGDVVWEGVGGAAGLNGAEGADLNSLVRQASIGLAKRIGKSPTEVPPPQNAETIYQSQSSNTTVYLSVTTILLSLTALLLLL